eukprot:9838585-Alexandrium_andersonii.AAC.1
MRTGAGATRQGEEAPGVRRLRPLQAGGARLRGGRTLERRGGGLFPAARAPQGAGEPEPFKALGG